MNENRPPPQHQYSPGSKQFGFRANALMVQTIETLSEERHQTYSNTIRLLINLGLKHYEINKIAGDTNHEKAEQSRNLQAAQAGAAAAQKTRKRGKKCDIAPAVTVMLTGTDEPD